MSKSKSLGSSPIGYSSSGNERYNFIPDLGVSHVENKEESISAKSTASSESEMEDKKIHKLFDSSSQKEQKKEKKKIASYYLEKGIITRLKQVSEKHNIYYSTFVSDAIKSWTKNHNYD